MVPVGNVGATVPQPVAAVGGDAALALDRGPPRRRSPGRGAARPTARPARSDTSAGSMPPAPGDELARGTPRRRRRPCAGSTAARSAARLMQLDEPLARLAAGADAVGGLDHAVLDRDDRLDREQRPDGRLGAADPAALLEVLERLEGHVRSACPARVARASSAISAAETPVGRHLDGHPASMPSPIEAPSESTMWISRSGSMSRAIWALLIVPDSVPATWIETIARRRPRRPPRRPP